LTANPRETRRSTFAARMTSFALRPPMASVDQATSRRPHDTVMVGWVRAFREERDPRRQTKRRREGREPELADEPAVLDPPRRVKARQQALQLRR